MKIVLFILFLCLWSCTHAPVCTPDVSDILYERIGESLSFDQSCIQDYTNALLKDPISIESAIIIALLNNPEIGEFLEEVNVAYADLIEAGLFTNPAFEIEARYPFAKRLHTNIEYLVSAAFLDIFLIPVRTRIAAAELEQVKLKAANKILEIVFAVKRTYIELQAEQQKLICSESLAELAMIQKEIASRQLQAGNVYSLNDDVMEMASLKFQLQIIQTRNFVVSLQERLNRLLGLDISSMLSISEPLQENRQALDLGELENMALRNRTDLEAARYEICRISSMLGLKAEWAYTNLNAGLAGEREPDGENLVGFGISGQIPIFNYGQAARMRLHAQLRQAYHHLDALELKAVSEVRETYKHLENTLAILDGYKTQLLPRQEMIFNSTEALYNVMGASINSLLETKRDQIEMTKDYIESIKAYRLAKLSLDQALGGYVTWDCT